MFKVKIWTPERRQWRRFDIFIVNFEKIFHIVLVFRLLTLNKQMPSGYLYFELAYFLHDDELLSK